MTTRILQSRPVEAYTQLNCPHCTRLFEYPSQPSSSASAGRYISIQCCFCQKVVQHSPGNAPNTSKSTFAGKSGEPSSTGNGTGAKRNGRKIGTQERPLETGYYDTLGVSVLATDEEIKKAYRRLAIKHHPDKNRGDPDAESRFKDIGIAYQTLSDPVLRKKYNEFGPKESAPEGGYVDPEEIFGAIFGGERFMPIIGEISLARDMKSAMQEAEEAEEEGADGTVAAAGAAKGNQRKVLSPEEKAKKDEKARARAAQKAAVRKERVEKLITELERKLSIFTESATGVPYKDKDVTQSWKTICQFEAEELKKESYGYDLLQAIGFVYSSKAKHYIASEQTLFGVGGWLHNVQGKYHVFSETVSTVRAAIELKAVFDQIQAAEKNGNLTEAERKKLEEQAAEKGLSTLFKGAKLEIESVLREVCDRLLLPSAPPSSSSASNVTSPSSGPNALASQHESSPSHLALSGQYVSKEKVHLRAVALQILGEAYMNVKKDSTNEELGEGYVKVDVKS